MLGGVALYVHGKTNGECWTIAVFELCLRELVEFESGEIILNKSKTTLTPVRIRSRSMISRVQGIEPHSFDIRCIDFQIKYKELSLKVMKCVSMSRKGFGGKVCKQENLPIVMELLV